MFQIFEELSQEPNSKVSHIIDQITPVLAFVTLLDEEKVKFRTNKILSKIQKAFSSKFPLSPKVYKGMPLRELAIQLIEILETLVFEENSRRKAELEEH